MFYFINFIDCSKYMLILNLFPAIHFKEIRTTKEKIVQCSPIWQIPQVKGLIDNG